MNKRFITALSLLMIAGLATQHVLADGTDTSAAAPKAAEVTSPASTTGAPAQPTAEATKKACCTRAYDYVAKLCSDNPKTAYALGISGITLAVFITLWKTSKNFRNAINVFLGLPEEQDEENTSVRYSYLS